MMTEAFKGLSHPFPVHISMDHHTYNMNRFLLTFIIDNNSLQSIFRFFVFKKEGVFRDKKSNQVFRFFSGDDKGII